MKTLKTKLHTYCVARGSDESKEIDKLRESTQGDGAGKIHCCISGIGYQSNFGHKVEMVTLETEFLYGNQWNEAGENGRRLFDHYEESIHARGFKNTRYGHWLEVTPEMIAIRQSVHVCGYCGKHYAKPVNSFCDACLGSEYLDENELHLLRLLPVCDSFGGERPELTKEEYAVMLPAYWEAQGLGKESREAAKLKGLRLKVSKIVSDAEAEAAKKIKAARIEQEGKNWLLDNGYRGIDNVIYYTHSDTWAFGWRNKLSDDEKSMLIDLLCEFPFDYEFKNGI